LKFEYSGKQIHCYVSRLHSDLCCFQSEVRVFAEVKFSVSDMLLFTTWEFAPQTQRKSWEKPCPPSMAPIAHVRKNCFSIWSQYLSLYTENLSFRAEKGPLRFTQRTKRTKYYRQAYQIFAVLYFVVRQSKFATK